MADCPIRIAMWSGPRNISTAMMRSFGNRSDTWVADEPFYAAYLAVTGIRHPLREESLASQPTDWREVVQELLGPVPNGKALWYQKHMTHHMLPPFGRDWMGQCLNAFLIRAPEDVLASYTEKRGEVTLDDIGFIQQREIFEREADRLGRVPPVIDAADVLGNPRGVLRALCGALQIPFVDEMLSWPPGRRHTDGAWAPAWYDAVERSTGFVRPKPPVRLQQLRDDLKPIVLAARPHYERMHSFRLAAGEPNNAV
ncbi:MAG: HAD family hydrolase [Alphaproteobacteria bacterium]|nr:HAD family hydrolase [Alphaproteobacteria bacterium]